jgi:hypothetical protein
MTAAGRESKSPRASGTRGGGTDQRWAPRPATNRSSLVTVAVAGLVAPPRVHPEALQHDRDGRSYLLPGTGGVHPGVHVGDPVERWLADHLMVGASIEDPGSNPAEPGPLHRLACLGNRVRDGAGEAIGVVAGKRGGLAPGFLPPNLVSVEASAGRLAGLAPGAPVVVEAVGRGLQLVDWPDVQLLNVSPQLLDMMPIRVAVRRLEIAVRAIVPSRVAGAGIGQDAWIGDLEIADPDAWRREGDGLGFGDLVAFDAIDGRFGRYWRPGIVAVGAVAHGPSPAPGHGIGVTILVSGPAEQLRPVVSTAGTVAPALTALARRAGSLR